MKVIGAILMLIAVAGAWHGPVKVLGVWSDLPGVLPGHVVMRVELCSRVQP
jgi:hypothetical protein